MPEIDFDALANEHGGAAVAAPDFDALASEFGGEHVAPQGALGTFWTGIKSQAIPGITSALGMAGGAALGVPADAATMGGASIALGLAGAEAGGAVGQKLQEQIFSRESLQREQAQIAANQLAGHELASGAGEMLPALTSVAGFEKGLGKAGIEAAARMAGKKGLERAAAGIGHAARTGLLMGGAAEGQRQAREGELDPLALVTHPAEEAIKFAPVGAIPGFGVGLKKVLSEDAYKGFGGMADNILGGIAKGIPDAAVMSLSGNLYDHFVHDKPLDFSTIKDETGQSIPSFMLLNGIMGALHAPDMISKIQQARRAAGKGELDAEDYVRANQGEFEASMSAAKEAAAKVDEAAVNAADNGAPAVAEALQEQKVDVATAAANEAHKQAAESNAEAMAKVEESIKAAQDFQEQQTKELEQQKQASEANVQETQPPAEPAESTPVNAQEAEAQVPPVAGAEQAPSGAGAAEAEVAAESPREYRVTDPDSGELVGGPNRFIVSKNASEGHPTSHQTDPLAEEMGAAKTGSPQGKYRVTIFQGDEPLSHESFSSESEADAYAKKRHGQLQVQSPEQPPVRTETPPAAPEAKEAPKAPEEAPKQPEAPQSTEPANPHIRSMRVNGEEVTADLGPEGAKKFDALTEEAKGATKGRGMAISAEKRKLHPSFQTAKEAEAEKKRLAGNYKGKEVSVDGRNGKVIANPFGEVTVQFEDGTKRTVSKNKIQPKIEPKIEQPQPSKTDALPERSPAEVLPREQGEAPEAGSERGGVGQGKQGPEPTREETPPPSEAEGKVRYMAGEKVDDAQGETEVDFFDAKTSGAREFISKMWDGYSLGKLTSKLDADGGTVPLERPHGGVRDGGTDYRSIDVRWNGEEFEEPRGNEKPTHRIEFHADADGETNVDKVFVLNPKKGMGTRYMAGEKADKREYSDKRISTGIPEGTPASRAGYEMVAEGKGLDPYPKTEFVKPEVFVAKAKKTPHAELKQRVINEIYEGHDRIDQLDLAKAQRLYTLLNADLDHLDAEIGKTRSVSKRFELGKERAHVEDLRRKTEAVLERGGKLFTELGHLMQQELDTEFRRENILKKFREARGRPPTPEEKRRDDEDIERITKMHSAFRAKRGEKAKGAREAEEQMVAERGEAIRKTAKDVATGKKAADLDYAEPGRNSINKVKEMMRNHGITGKIKVVYDPEPKTIKDPATGKPIRRHMRGWVEKDGTVVYNAREITSDDVLINLYQHENAHLASDDPAVRKMADPIIRAVKGNKKLAKELEEHLSKYREDQSKGEDPEEALGKAVELLNKHRATQGAFEKLWRSIKTKFGLGSDFDLAQQTAVKAMDRLLRKQKSETLEGADGKRYMAAEEAKGEPAEETNPQLTDEQLDAALDQKIKEASDPKVALELAITKNSGKGKPASEFMKSVVDSFNSNPNFKDLTPDEIIDQAVELMSERFKTKGKLKKELQQLHNDLNKEEKGSPKAEALKRLIKQYQQKLESGNFTKESPKVERLTQDEHELKLQLDEVKRQFYNAQIQRRLESRPFAQKVWDGTADALNFARAIMTSGDLSAVLRQGIFPALSHPVMTLKAMPAMFKAMRSVEAQRAEMNRIRHRENAPLYEEAEVFMKDPDEANLSSMEESFMSRWIAKWPGGLKGLGLGSFVRGSERAYVTFLNRIRADLFDTLYSATKKPQEGMTHEELKALGNAVNVFTGRGKIFGRKGGSAGLNTIFFAPNYVASVFNTMFGQPLYHGTTATRKAVAGEYARFIGAAGLLYSLAAMTLGEDDGIETDPRSSDFGRIRYGNTRVNPLGGILQNTTLLSRLATGETKTLGGQVKPLSGDTVKYGGQTTTDVLGRYMRQKLSPVIGATVSGLEGKTVVGEETDMPTELGKLFVPISIRDIGEAMEDQGIPKGTALSLLSLFGMGVNTYNNDKR